MIDMHLLYIHQNESITPNTVDRDIRDGISCKKTYQAPQLNILTMSYVAGGAQQISEAHSGALS